jgi:hypothetical protein
LKYLFIPFHKSAIPVATGERRRGDNAAGKEGARMIEGREERRERWKERRRKV